MEAAFLRIAGHSRANMAYTHLHIAAAFLAPRS